MKKPVVTAIFIGALLAASAGTMGGGGESLASIQLDSCYN